MSKHAKHAAPRAARTGRSANRPVSSEMGASGTTAGRHRSAPQRGPLAAAPRKALGTSVLLGSVAVAATGTTVAGGILSSSSAGPATPASASLAAAAAAPAATADPERAAEAAAASLERAPQVSRSADRRDDTDPVKQAALSDARADGPAQTGEQDLSDGDPRDIARVLLAEFGFSSDQFGCLDSLYVRESNWNPRADNPSSSAYGIPQALPGSKMASAGADWATNPVTQIRWGLGYIRDRYGSPCGAWGHSQSRGWY
ncbi:lytic transglycosylase domain-containing protein [Nocardioides sp.]|uniref:aggregation-promoting factor C-terminal-like domain-containing protein n=1 Tax=Nocardioides sp. TaxID=35761 RepID=UPI002626D01F|nr:lytic transglycosylase domain-containing protein [Nocardioides sp.]